MASSAPEVFKQVEASIFLAGTELGGDYEFQSISVSKEINKIPTAIFSIIDGDPSKQDFELSADTSTALEPGKEIEIKVKGGTNTTISLFKGIIIRHGIKVRGNASVLVLECQDKAVKMTYARENQFFEKKKDSDVITTLIGDSGASADVEATTFQHPELLKYDCSDWDFMLLRAELNGQVVITDAGKVSVKKPVFSNKKNLKLEYGTNIIEVEGEVDAVSQLQKVKAEAWDFSEQKVINAEGDAATVTVPDQGNLKAADMAKVASPAIYNLYHPGPEKSANLTDWTKAQMLKSRMAKVKGRVKTNGFDVAPGDVLELAGCGKRFNGDIYVTGVRHDVLEGQWVTNVQFGLSEQWFSERHDINVRPTSSLMPGMNGLQIGKVKALEGDPDSQNRIQVTLKMFGDKANVWCRMIFEYAGGARGKVFLPEVDDEVLVGFLNDDPRYPVVLGSFYCSKAAPPMEWSDDNHEKGIWTRSNMMITFDDEKSIMHFETPGGHKVDLDDDAGAVSIECSNGNKLTFDDGGITMKSCKDMTFEASGNIKIKTGSGNVDIETGSGNLTTKGMNVEHKASTNYKASGGAQAELSGSAMTTIKGGMVKIN